MDYIGLIWTASCSGPGGYTHELPMIQRGLKYNGVHGVPYVGGGLVIALPMVSVDAEMMGSPCGRR